MLPPGRPRPLPHSIGDSGRAGTNQPAVFFNHACVTRLNRAELRVVADVGNGVACALDKIDQKLVGLGFLNGAVDSNLDHSFFLHTTSSASSAIVARGSELNSSPAQLNTIDACNFFHSPQHSRKVLFSIACQFI